MPLGTYARKLHGDGQLYNDCGRKKGYHTTKEANQAIHRASRHTGATLRYYHCSFCGKYHLTKRPQDEYASTRRNPLRLGRG